MQIHGSPSIVSIAFMALCARGIGAAGSGSFMGTAAIPAEFCQGIERGFRSENGLSVRMLLHAPTTEQFCENSPQKLNFMKKICTK
jgi:hypothetical protein